MIMSVRLVEACVGVPDSGHGKWISAAVLVAGFLAMSSDIAPAETLRGFTPVNITGEPVRFGRLQPLAQKFGSLIYRGGLALNSASPAFGGLSGLGISEDGSQILVISDVGHLFAAELAYSDAQLSGIRNGQMSSLKGSKGQPLPSESKNWHDAEGLALGPDRLSGPMWVSFERHHRLERYEFGKYGADAPATRTQLPPHLKKRSRNGGVEALARFGTDSDQNGALLMFAENPDRNGTIPGHILGGPAPGPLTLQAPGGFSVTDAAFLPGGDLVLLERRFGNLLDFSFRIRRVAGETIRAHAVLAASTLFEGGLTYEIDNFEGLAVHTAANGETRLTLISDDNFSAIQQTLLLQFALDE